MKHLFYLSSVVLAASLSSCGGDTPASDLTSEAPVETTYLEEDIIREKNSQGEYWFKLRNGDTLFDGQTFEVTNYAFQNGYCIVGKTIDGSVKRGAIDLKGNLVIDYKYEHLDNCEDNGYFQFKGRTDDYGFALGYVDSTGKEVIEQKYSKSSGVRDNMVKLKTRENKWGILNMQHEVIIPFEYDFIGRWQEELSNVKKEKEGYGYVNKKGELIIPLKYDDALGFEMGVALVKQNGKWGLIDKNDQIVSDFIYDDFEWVVDVVESVVDASGYAEENKRFVMEEGYIILSKGGKWGYLNTKGEIVIPFEYDSINVPSGGTVSVSKDGKRGLFNLSDKTVKWS